MGANPLPIPCQLPSAIWCVLLLQVLTGGTQTLKILNKWAKGITKCIITSLICFGSICTSMDHTSVHRRRRHYSGSRGTTRAASGGDRRKPPSHGSDHRSRVQYRCAGNEVSYTHEVSRLTLFAQGSIDQRVQTSFKRGDVGCRSQKRNEPLKPVKCGINSDQLVTQKYLRAACTHRKLKYMRLDVKPATHVCIFLEHKSTLNCVEGIFTSRWNLVFL